MTVEASAPRASGESLVVLAGVALMITFAEIGWASGERIRHLIQATPVLIATLAAWRWPAVGRWALAPIFLFWLAIGIMIWMFLLGLPSPVHGTFNPWERLGAAGLAAVPLAGFSVFPRVRRPLPWYWAASAFAGFAALQFAGFVLSTQPAYAAR